MLKSNFAIGTRKAVAVILPFTTASVAQFALEVNQHQNYKHTNITLAHSSTMISHPGHPTSISVFSCNRLGKSTCKQYIVYTNTTTSRTIGIDRPWKQDRGVYHNTNSDLHAHNPSLHALQGPFPHSLIHAHTMCLCSHLKSVSRSCVQSAPLSDEAPCCNGGIYTQSTCSSCI